MRVRILHVRLFGAMTGLGSVVRLRGVAVRLFRVFVRIFHLAWFLLYMGLICCAYCSHECFSQPSMWACLGFVVIQWWQLWHRGTQFSGFVMLPPLARVLISCTSVACARLQRAHGVLSWSMLATKARRCVR